MIGSQDIIHGTKKGFDGEKYIQLQKKAIKQRIQQFTGRLYLEIGGKFLYDPHATRVLPGFFADSKKQIFESMKDNMDIIFCINARDIEQDRQLLSEKQSYISVCMEMIAQVRNLLGITPRVAINRVSSGNFQQAKDLQQMLEKKGIKGYLRYEIHGYPQDTEKILSSEGYGKDEYIPTTASLVLVTGAASSSGKMSTCLGQIFHETQQHIDSGYAKYETFPIWNLPLEHPVNLAYEAATADIGDYNMMDLYHETAYGMLSVNYNRDVEAFEIVMQLAQQFLPEDTTTRKYRSPTDMGINMAGYCITDDSIIQKASIGEIQRRLEWYQALNDKKAVRRCEELLKKAR